MGGPGAGTLSTDLSTNNPAQTGAANIGPGGPAQAEIVSGGTAALLGLVPYAISNAGQVAGSVGTGNMGFDPAVSQGGKVTNLGPALTIGQWLGNGNAIAINQKGDVLVTMYEGATNASLIYSTTAGRALVNITSLPGGSGLVVRCSTTRTRWWATGFSTATERSRC